MVEVKKSVTKSSTPSILVEQHIIESDFLEREVRIDFYLPVNVKEPKNLSLLLINDGQDLVRMPFDSIIEDLTSSHTLKPLLCVGIHCGTYRDQEYGTDCMADYKGRGAERAFIQNLFLMS